MPPWANRLKNQLKVFERKMVFFGDQRAGLTIKKANFPENTLVYISNGSVTPVKGRHAIYLEYVILAQILPVANPLPEVDVDNHKYLDNEVLIFTPLYNSNNGLYKGLKKDWAILF